MIPYLVCLVRDDDALAFSDMIPRTVLTLGVRPGLNSQSILWKEDISDVPVFRAPVRMDD